ARAGRPPSAGAARRRIGAGPRRRRRRARGRQRALARAGRTPPPFPPLFPGRQEGNAAPAPTRPSARAPHHRPRDPPRARRGPPRGAPASRGARVPRRAATVAERGKPAPRPGPPAGPPRRAAPGGGGTGGGEPRTRRLGQGRRRVIPREAAPHRPRRPAPSRDAADEEPGPLSSSLLARARRHRAPVRETEEKKKMEKEKRKKKKGAGAGPLRRATRGHLLPPLPAPGGHAPLPGQAEGVAGPPHRGAPHRGARLWHAGERPRTRPRAPARASAPLPPLSRQGGAAEARKQGRKGGSPGRGPRPRPSRARRVPHDHAVRDGGEAAPHPSTPPVPTTSGAPHRARPSRGRAAGYREPTEAPAALRCTAPVKLPTCRCPRSGSRPARAGRLAPEARAPLGARPPASPVLSRLLGAGRGGAPARGPPRGPAPARNRAPAPAAAARWARTACARAPREPSGPPRPLGAGPGRPGGGGARAAATAEAAAAGAPGGRRRRRAEGGAGGARRSWGDPREGPGARPDGAGGRRARPPPSPAAAARAGRPPHGRGAGAGRARRRSSPSAPGFGETCCPGALTPGRRSRGAGPPARRRPSQPTRSRSRRTAAEEMRPARAGRRPGGGPRAGPPPPARPRGRGPGGRRGGGGGDPPGPRRPAATRRVESSGRTARAPPQRGAPRWRRARLRAADSRLSPRPNPGSPRRERPRGAAAAPHRTGRAGHRRNPRRRRAAARRSAGPPPGHRTAAAAPPGNRRRRFSSRPLPQARARRKADAAEPGATPPLPASARRTGRGTPLGRPPASPDRRRERRLRSD
ncbi:unnamed protein product, partial [Bubo scandiacus]